MKTHSCPICNKVFTTYLKNPKYCSRQCFFIGHSRNLKGKFPEQLKDCERPAPWNKNRTNVYSLETRKKMSEAKKGRQCGLNNYNWKGGRNLTSQGYMSLSINGRWVMEHRYVMEQHLQRRLEKYEQVHHMNGIKTDNRIENLKIVMRKNHFGDIRCPHCLKEFSMR